MKDDSDLNINFVALIERHPCIYDYTSSDYSRRNVQDKAWETIAKEISETVEDCKDRWKNLRGCYTRYLKSLTGPSGSGAKTRKPYYLAEHLHFLQRFTKSRKPKGNILSTKTLISSPEMEQTILENIDHSDNEAEEERIMDAPTEENVSPSTSSKPPESNYFRTPASVKPTKHHKFPISIAEVNKSALEYFESKKLHTNDNADLDFFKSVLPDMKEMSNDQKRRFKIGILNLAGQILGESNASMTTNSLSDLQPVTHTSGALPVGQISTGYQDHTIGEFLQFNSTE